MLQCYHKLQRKPKQFLSLKNALQLIWSALTETAIDNAVKDYRERLQTLSANGGHFEHLTDTNCYI